MLNRKQSHLFALAAAGLFSCSTLTWAMQPEECERAKALLREAATSDFQNSRGAPLRHSNSAFAFTGTSPFGKCFIMDFGSRHGLICNLLEAKYEREPFTVTEVQRAILDRSIRDLTADFEACLGSAPEVSAEKENDQHWRWTLSPKTLGIEGKYGGTVTLTASRPKVGAVVSGRMNETYIDIRFDRSILSFR